MPGAPTSSDPIEARVASALAELAPVGRRPSGGYARFAWTVEDAAMRRWFVRQAEERALSTEVDRNGNQWAWWGAPGPGAIVTGSHLDSVPDGGAFDGPLGVISAFLALDEMRAAGAMARRPVAVVNFADEEGARFGVACLGSRLSCGTFDAAEARALVDADGTTLADALRLADVDPGALGRDDERMAQIGAFVELHVEQGRRLGDLGAPVGVATAIWPHGRWRLRFSGQANHAGTTAMGDRCDPVLPFAATVLAARRSARAHDAHATVGRVLVTPNGANVIASSVEAWLDARAPAQQVLEAMVAEVAAAARDDAASHGVKVEVQVQSISPEVRFSEGLAHRLVTTLGGAPAIPTGAGHDAGVLSSRVPSAMLFVRNESGVSHSPAEHAELADCAEGVRALSRVLGDLACTP